MLAIRQLRTGSLQRLTVHRHRGIGRNDVKCDRIGGDLPLDEGITIVKPRRSGDKVLIQRRGKAFQLFGGLCRGVGVGCFCVKIEATVLVHRTVVFIANDAVGIRPTGHTDIAS